MRKLFLLLIFFCFSIKPVLATHNRSGEITFRQLSQLTYEIHIVTYTKTSSPADRPSLEINWGGGIADTSLLSRNGNGQQLPNNIKKNDYVGVHTYPGAGKYIIFFEDPNRDANIINIPGASDQVPFYVETELLINPYQGYNNSPVLLQPPIDQGAVGRIFIHNPNGYDPDGDLLKYKLVSCRGASGLVIPGYFVPANITLDSLTGNLVWNTPQQIGEFNFAIEISEYRNGKKIGYIIRDLQVEIHASNNNPPIVKTVSDTCIEAGTTLTFNVTATDPDNNPINIYASGGPFVVTNSQATFTSPAAGVGSASGVFSWKTQCEHIRKQPYQVVFKAEDNGSPAPILADLKYTLIRIVPPSPKNPSATAQGNTIKLKWDPEICSQALGYKIYRKTDSIGFTPSNCETGVPASTGYKQIDQITGINNVNYNDDDKGVGLTTGNRYCYMIVAYFPEDVESYASVEVCAELKKDVPVMTKVSVLTTDPSNGKISLRWSRPNAKDLDTIANAKPYKFVLYRESGGAATKVDSSIAATYSAIGSKDTTYVDSLLNTQDIQYTYFVKFYSNGTAYKGQSSKASSIFLTITPSDNRLTLSWQTSVPWTNKTYSIYRKDNTSGIFNLLNSTTDSVYTDSSLANGISHCYYIESSGGFSSTSFPNPIINLSQQACSTPIDNIVPCATSLTVTSYCENFANKIDWRNPNKKCSDDVLSYHVYYKPSTDAQWDLVYTSTPADPFTPEVFSFNHQDLNLSAAGCYAVTGIDSAGNESAKSPEACVDNCPDYKLPNAFTPNNDGINDFFRPLDGYRYIHDVDIKIFNRWGALMFTSIDPEINWDGRNQANGQACGDGVYFYICQLHETHLDKLVPRTLKGFIELLRNGVTQPSNTPSN